MLKPFNPDFPAISGRSLFRLDKFGTELKYSVQILGCDERRDGQVRLIQVGMGHAHSGGEARGTDSAISRIGSIGVDDHEMSRPSHLICLHSGQNRRVS